MGFKRESQMTTKKLFHTTKFDLVSTPVLDSEWGAAISIRTILLSVRNLLEKPMPETLDLPDLAANPEAALLYLTDKNAYEDRAKTIVDRSLEARRQELVV